MKSVTEKKSAQATKYGYAYLTKRIIVRRAKMAGRLAARRAMETMGFVITTRKGWLVKKYADGQIEEISKIPE